MINIGFWRMATTTGLSSPDPNMAVLARVHISSQPKGVWRAVD
jgi:hypothetical protein